MRSPLSSGPALAAALTGLFGLASAQAIFGSVDAELAVCRKPGLFGGLEGFSYLGCYTGFTDNILFQFVPQPYNPADYGQSFLGWNPGSPYDFSMTPLSCARACRGHGFKYSVVRDNQCRCGMQFPTVSSTGAAVTSVGTTLCNIPCGGDSTQTCGGVSFAQVYVDLTFASDAVIQTVPENTGLAASYRYLGCYRTNGFQFQDSRLVSDVTGYDSVDQCFRVCAGFGYPLVFAEPLASGTPAVYSGRVKCRCGTAFEPGNFRQRPESLQTPGDCSAECATNADTCNVTTLTNSVGGVNRCCGRNGNAPVYINPELQGCYTPPIPGFKATDYEPVFGCYDVPSSLTGAGRTLVQQVQRADAPLLDPGARDKAALLRPPTVNSSVGTQFFLYGCYNGPAAGITAALINGVLNAVQSHTGGDINTLEKCATACNAYTYFGMTNGNRCYCATQLFDYTLIPLLTEPVSPDDSFRSCNIACMGNPAVACGGDEKAVVYAISRNGISRGVYESYSATSLATPPPVYSCTPTGGNVVTTVSTTSILTTVTESVTVASQVTTVLSGSTVTVNVTSISATTFTTQLPPVTATATATETVGSITISRTITETITTPSIVVNTVTAGGTTVSVTQTREVVVTTTRVLVETVADRTITETFLRAGETVTVTYRHGQTGGPGGPNGPGGPGGGSYGEGEDCTNGICTLSLRFGALRLPSPTPNGGGIGSSPATLAWVGAPVCSVETRSWVAGATTLLPLAAEITYAAEPVITIL